jgi:hypothetical protein
MDRTTAEALSTANNDAEVHSETDDEANITQRADQPRPARRCAVRRE